MEDYHKFEASQDNNSKALSQKKKKKKARKKEESQTDWFEKTGGFGKISSI